MAKLSWVSASLFIAVVALAPWPYGSVDVIWTPFWCALLAVSLMTVSLWEVRRVHLQLIAPAVFCIITYAAAVGVQTFQDPPLNLAHPIWSKAQGLLGINLPQRISVNTHGWVSLGLSFAVFLAFMCGFLNSVPRSRAWIILRAIAFSGAFYAVYSLSTFLYDHSAIIWSGKAAQMGSLRSPFGSRNHAATYFGSCSIVWFSLVLSELERPLSHKGLGIINAVRMVVEESPWKLFVALAAFLLCLTATFLTQSRAGVLLTLAALGVCAALFGYRWLPSHPKSLLISAVAVLAGGLFIELWGGPVASRIGMQGLKDLERWETYRSTLALIRDYPLLGTGAGTFETVFPAYRTDQVSTTRVWDYAHNTLLEIAAELGVFIALAIVLTVSIYGILLVRGSLVRRRDATISLIGLGVGLLAGSHALIDFSLQIPGYAIPCAAILGCCLAQSISTHATTRSLPTSGE